MTLENGIETAILAYSVSIVGKTLFAVAVDSRYALLFSAHDSDLIVICVNKGPCILASILLRDTNTRSLNF